MTSGPKSLLRVAATGSVDDGKSTLIGRLLFEAQGIFEDQFEAIRKTSARRGNTEPDLALLLDGLSSEREQGITIDVAYRFFETAKRRFVLADCPGHEQYTRNMVTGTSKADCAIVLIDARHGLLTQSRRHSVLASLMRVPILVVAINKMDLVDYHQGVFERIQEDFRRFAETLEVDEIHFIPVSALQGDNITQRSARMPWYKGPSLLEHLENLPSHSQAGPEALRFPVQLVIRPDQDFRGYAGQLLSGTVRLGEELAVMPSGKTSRVQGILGPEGPLEEGKPGQSLVLALEDELDVNRGDMLVHSRALPQIGQQLQAVLCWLDESPMEIDSPLLLQHTTRTVRATVSLLHHAIDVNTLAPRQASALGQNDIGRAEILTTTPICFDTYQINRATGNFILVDPLTNRTVAAGMIQGQPQEKNPQVARPKGTHLQNVHPNRPLHHWEDRNGHAAAVLWFTGLSGSGKTTLAKALEEQLFGMGCQVTILDGDRLRHGLCRDLGFSREERSENIRRVGEVASILFEAGHIVLCTLISPFEADRARARSLVPEGRFLETYVAAGVEACRVRDPRGLYRKALRGEIPEFTGISSPYETPRAPELVLDTERCSVEELVNMLVLELRNRRFLNRGA